MPSARRPQTTPARRPWVACKWHISTVGERGRERTPRGKSRPCVSFGDAIERPEGHSVRPCAAQKATCIPTNQPQLLQRRCSRGTGYGLVSWQGNARSTGWARNRAQRDTIGFYSVTPEGVAGCRSEPATANAARKRATTSHRALRRPAAWASKPMAGGPARLAK